MKRNAKRVAIWGLLFIVVLFVASAIWNRELVQRLFLGGVRVYETEPPALPVEMLRPAILVFSKTNGFRHEEAIPAANAMLAGIAKAKGWGYYQTENGAAFSPDILSRFDAVVLNNVSGDVFTPAQRQAFKAYLEGGGGFVGIHGSGGDFKYDWQWYVNDLIGAQFIGHTMDPQFQQATVRVADPGHPATRELPSAWQWTEEWYSFDRSVRTQGYKVLLDVDEQTYKPDGMWGQDLRMGKDHPVAWWHCIGKGRVFYSALGHRPEAYAAPEFRHILTGSLAWTLRQEGTGCDGPEVPRVKQ